MVVATITLARTQAQADQLYAALACLSQLELPIIVADGGSDRMFVDRLAALPHVQLAAQRQSETPGLVSQIQRALITAHGSGARDVFYTEPDKHWFFTHRLRDFLAYASNIPEDALVLAARDEASFATFPEGQQRTERMINDLCAATFGCVGDYTYGPLLIPAVLVPHVENVAADLGWGWRFWMMALAWRCKIPLRHAVADLPCPLDQRSEDDQASRIYRMEQLAQNVRGLALGLKHKLDAHRP